MPVNMRWQLLLCLVMSGLARTQVLDVNMLAARQTTDRLSQLESLGVQLLSSILSPSETASIPSTALATPTSLDSSFGSVTSSGLNFSTLSTSSTTTASSTSQTLSSSSTSSTSSSTVAAAESASTPSSSALPVTEAENTRHRNIAIIVGSVLGGAFLLLCLILLWVCCMKRRRQQPCGRSAPKEIDDDELDPIAGGGPVGMAYVTRIESWHEPRNSRNSSRGPPRNSQSRVSLVHRDIPERYNSGPSAPVPLPIPPPHRASQYGLIQNESHLEDPQPVYYDRPQRHSMDDATRDPSRYPGYVPYRSSTHSLVERSPTPLFGTGKTPGENAIKRKSVGSSPTTAVNTAPNSNDPSPNNNNGSGPWVPPKYVGRRRESLPGSPLANEFDFGFGTQGRKVSRERMPGSWSNNSVADAHHRF